MWAMRCVGEFSVRFPARDDETGHFVERYDEARVKSITTKPVETVNNLAAEVRERRYVWQRTFPP
jgi:hypothetical protein